MSELDATVVIPTFDHGPTLRPVVASALAQRDVSFEVLLIGDGVPDAARAVCEELAAADPRVTFLDRPKGPRNGEEHRHEALVHHARGRIVCYLSDDDLWLPDHLATMRQLLADADFAHTLPVSVAPDGTLGVYRMELSSSWFRPRAFDDRGIRGAWVPLTFAGHALDAYRRLPEGWTPTPRPLPTDRYMWHKLVREPWVRAVSGTRPTALHFASTARKGWTPEARVAELERWRTRLDGDDAVSEWRLEVLDVVARERALLDARPGRRVAEAFLRRVRTVPSVRRVRARRR